jgi:8-oxo-dGTP pyrophosphatase MutT (NUDIX family)
MPLSNKIFSSRCILEWKSGTPNPNEYSSNTLDILAPPENWTFLPSLAKLHQEMSAHSLQLRVWLEDGENLAELIKAYMALYQPITAAGGLVYTPNHQLLMIHRKGWWDLPKGKQDPGEDLLTCAVREVKEETLIPDITPGRKFGVTWHIYKLNNTWILKDSHWYYMESKEAYPLQPQTEEEITAAVWMDASQRKNLIPEMYPLIAELVKWADLRKDL